MQTKDIIFTNLNNRKYKNNYFRIHNKKIKDNRKIEKLTK